MPAEAGGEQRERSAGFIITAKRNGMREFLLLRHRGAGHWAFPKGRIENGEDELAAAMRETMEETGIGAVVPIPGFRVETAYCFVREGVRLSKRVTYFLAEVADAAVRLSHEHQESRWLGAQEAAELLTYDESRHVLERAARYLADGELNEDHVRVDSQEAR